MSSIRSYFYAKPSQTTLKTNTAVEIKSAPPSPPPERTKGYPNYYKINYRLQETWSGDSFFGNFDYYIQPDPTQGFVTYVNEGIAKAKNLTYSNANTAVIRVDDTTALTRAGGRDSIRLVSKKAYNGGLFLFDVAHVPYGCGTWPAIWMTSISNWPTQGEIDIMETVNQGGPNQMTLHTSSGCSMGGQRNQTGTTLTTDCYVRSDSNGSCAVMGSATSAGQAFNGVGGGVYALEWRSEGIRMWFFERSNIPANIGSPDPSSWPAASADFPNTNCDIGSHFNDLHIITNIALCGVWAGAADVYNGQDHCPSSCVNYVTANASAFEQAYFTYNSFKIFAAS
ncbi:hypothetical protein AMS68_004391 [Peltaster fructicola]|uniref:GH16 domain-containing protein n=1 Tax=Peltaster fructicola TaxID=286661 RepID=A0A6H0XVX2_9PEZI|nr:hypothetical protein AMS68_004391 [Peltaster fructicola]